ncbi:hypothetical protein SCUP515_05841 [Seiridium cupressi]
MLGPFLVAEAGAVLRLSANNETDAAYCERLFLIIAVMPGSTSKKTAQSALLEFCRVLHQYGEDGFVKHVAIEILEAQPVHHEQTTLNTTAPSDLAADYNLVPTPGCSIGRADLACSGSLGPILRLELLNPTLEMLLGVTCAHVLAPGRPGAISLQGEKLGIIESPSNVDHAWWLEELGQRLLNPRTLQEPTLHQQLKTAQNFARPIGSLVHTSGLTAKFCRVDDGTYCRLDYGSFRLNDERSASISTSFSNAPSQRLIKHVIKSGYHDEEAKQQRWVFKAGRTTGSTIGKEHGTTLVIRMYQGSSLVTETTERAILPHKDPMFAAPGDSGALVYNAAIKPLGLFWGGLKRPESSMSTNEDHSEWHFDIEDREGINIEGICFYTPIDVLLDSMLADFTKAYGKDGFNLFWGEAGTRIRQVKQYSDFISRSNGSQFECSNKGWPVPDTMSLPWDMAYGRLSKVLNHRYPLVPMPKYIYSKYKSGTAAFVGADDEEESAWTTASRAPRTCTPHIAW